MRANISRPLLPATSQVVPSLAMLVVLTIGAVGGIIIGNGLTDGKILVPTVGAFPTGWVYRDKMPRAFFSIVAFYFVGAATMVTVVIFGVREIVREHRKRVRSVVEEKEEIRLLAHNRKMPNQSPDPTPAAVTPAAEPPTRQP